MEKTTEYTLRLAQKEDAKRLLFFHDLHGQGLLDKRSLQDLLTPIEKGNYFLVERDCDKELFGMGGAFQVSQNHFFLGSCIDKLRNKGVNRLYPIFVELSVLTICSKLFLKSFTDLVFYGEVAVNSPYRGILTNLIIKLGGEVIEPDSVMIEFANSHVLTGVEENPGSVFLGIPHSTIPSIAKRVLERGNVYTAQSRHYQEEQIIKVEVPILWDKDFLRRVASLNIHSGEFSKKSLEDVTSNL